MLEQIPFTEDWERAAPPPKWGDWNETATRYRQTFAKDAFEQDRTYTIRRQVLADTAVDGTPIFTTIEYQMKGSQIVAPGQELQPSAVMANIVFMRAYYREV